MVNKSGGTPVKLTLSPERNTHTRLGQHLAVDETRLYRINMNDNALTAIDRSGNVTQVLTDVHDPTGQIAVDESYVYWSWTGDTVLISGKYLSPMTIMKISKSGGTPIDVVADRESIWYFAVDEISVYWINSKGLMKVPK